MQERRRGRKVSTEGGYILPSEEERLGEKGGALFNGKEGRDDFRTMITPHPGDNKHIV